ncbi:hypothetical protein NLJ89_g7211 [Agrocybe chaxingu]|uniref:F-box domain-containing protein n=1 Tax=Agrocybe chaxingu TaxID=84603 RepID=A0A9W8K418_9AGAR|nr:hypothetical protein NLJ89_g7211 [Agrocybe chaxingu]
MQTLKSSPPKVFRSTYDRAARFFVLHAFKNDVPAPPYPNLLQSNVPPTDLEAVQIHEAIYQASVRKALLERQLSNARNTAGRQVAIHQRVKLIDEFICKHRRIISPLRHLPIDILFCIFSYLHPPLGEERYDVWCNTDGGRARWMISHVCRSWRRAALLMPTLWNTPPPLILESTSRRKVKVQAHILNEMIRRSQSVPLQLDIIVSSLTRGSENPILQTLVEHAESWGDVRLSIYAHTLEAFHGIKGRLTNLEVLGLTIANLTPGEFSFDLFETAPKLHQVSLSCWEGSTVHLPFSQIKCYTDFSSTMLFTMLSSAESLTHLYIDSRTAVTFPGPLVLPYLTELRIDCDDDITRALEQLSVPRIEKVTVRTSRTPDSASSLTTMLSNTSAHSPLKFLHYRNDGTDFGDLIPFFRRTPELVSLNVPLPIAPMILALADAVVLPHLEECTFYLLTLADAGQCAALDHLALSRCDGPASAAFNSGTVSGELIHSSSRLKKLSIVFNQSFCYHYGNYLVQASLNWVDVSFSPSTTAFQEMVGWLLDQSVRKLYPRCLRLEEVENALSAIERLCECPITYHTIIASGSHLTLRSIARFPLSEEAESQYRFHHRAQSLLNRWEPIFQGNLADIQWVFRGPKMLTYVPASDAIRESPSALDLIAYGFEVKAEPESN